MLADPRPFSEHSSKLSSYSRTSNHKPIREEGARTWSHCQPALLNIMYQSSAEVGALRPHFGDKRPDAPRPTRRPIFEICRPAISLDKSDFLLSLSDSRWSSLPLNSLQDGIRLRGNNRWISVSNQGEQNVSHFTVNVHCLDTMGSKRALIRSPMMKRSTDGSITSNLHVANSSEAMYLFPPRQCLWILSILERDLEAGASKLQTNFQKRMLLDLISRPSIETTPRIIVTLSLVIWTKVSNMTQIAWTWSTPGNIFAY